MDFYWILALPDLSSSLDVAPGATAHPWGTNIAGSVMLHVFMSYGPRVDDEATEADQPQTYA